MRRIGLLGAAGIAAVFLGGCDSGAGQQIPLTFGNPDPTDQTFSFTTPSGLVENVTVSGPSISTGTGASNTVTITAWLANNSQNPITALIRTCALDPSDFGADSAWFVAPDQASCVGKDTATVTVPTFGMTTKLTDTYAWTQPAGTYSVLVRNELNPVFWLTITIGSS